VSSEQRSLPLLIVVLARSFRRRANAEGVNYFQPRVARASALPWVITPDQVTTLKGL